MQSKQRQLEAVARQCLADTLAAAGLRSHAGLDRRELVLNELVERALLEYEEFRRFEDLVRDKAGADPAAFDRELALGFRRTTQLYLAIGRDLVGQLDDAVRDRLTVRNAMALRRAYAGLVALEALDYGLVPDPILAIAEVARTEHLAGRTELIGAESEVKDATSPVRSLRTWNFVKQTASLDPRIRRLAGRQYRSYFAAEDRHPALGGRPLLATRRAESVGDLWSVEITFTHRALAWLTRRDSTPEYVWFWIGSPDDIHRRIE